MANTPDYQLAADGDSARSSASPPKRLDGPQKSSRPRQVLLRPQAAGTCFSAVYLTSPHAHARITSIDTSAAEKMTGVKAVHVVSPSRAPKSSGQGTEIAAVAATTEEIARDAVRKIKVEYEVLPHLVNEDDLSQGRRARQSRRREAHRRSR